MLEVTSRPRVSVYFKPTPWLLSCIIVQLLTYCLVCTCVQAVVSVLGWLQEGGTLYAFTNMQKMSINLKVCLRHLFFHKIWKKYYYYLLHDSGVPKFKLSTFTSLKRRPSQTLENILGIKKGKSRLHLVSWPDHDYTCNNCHCFYFLDKVAQAPSTFPVENKKNIPPTMSIIQTQRHNSVVKESFHSTSSLATYYYTC